MALPKVIDHAARAVARLIQRFKNMPLMTGMIGAIGDEVQAAENGLYSLLGVRDIDAAEGVVLDKLGLLLGAPVRGPKNDASYRPILKTQVIANRSNGEAGSVYTCAKLMVAAWNFPGHPRITDQLPACYIISDDTVPNDQQQARELARLLDDVSSAGVRSIVESQSQIDADSFTFENGPGQGFGAGEFAGAYDGNQ